MARIKLTAKAIDSLTATTKQSDFWDVDLKGFGIRVTSSGRKSWFVFYRVGTRKRRLTIGTYPAIGLHEARQIGLAAIRDVSLGQDPAQRKYSERNSEDFHFLAQEYLERHAIPNKKSWKEDQRILNKEVLPNWGKLKVREIKKRDVLQLLDATSSRGAKIHANRVLALVRKIFNFGIERDLIEHNPCQTIKAPAKEVARQRVLSLEEIRNVWNAIEKQDVAISSLLKMHILTGQRGNEIRSMRWRDLDFDSLWWTIPSQSTKNSNSHRVPITDLFLKVLSPMRQRTSDCEWVFPSRKNSRKHIENIQKAWPSHG